MSSVAQTYETLSVDPGMEQITEDVFAFTGVIRPGRYFGVPHRMTVLRVPNTTDLVVYSPFDPSLVDLSSLGTVMAIVAPNSIHSMYPQSFLEAHPSATLYSSAALQAKFPDRDWGVIIDDSTPPDIISPHILVKSITRLVPVQEVLVLHVPSGTVLAADLAFNLTPQLRAKAPIGGRLFYRFASMPNPLDIHLGVRSWIRPYCREALPQMTAVMEDWEWDRLVPCHGDVVAKGAKEAFRRGMYRFVTVSAEAREWSVCKMIGVAVVGVVAAAGAGMLVRRNGGRTIAS